MVATDDTNDRLGSELGPSSPLLSFARAVVEHLVGSGALGPGEQVESEVIELLRLAEGGVSRQSIAFLANRPALLASVFQNADLLPQSTPEATRLATLVMSAVERMWDVDPLDDHA